MKKFSKFATAVIIRPSYLQLDGTSHIHQGVDYATSSSLLRLLDICSSHTLVSSAELLARDTIFGGRNMRDLLPLSGHRPRGVNQSAE